MNVKGASAIYYIQGYGQKVKKRGLYVYYY